MKTKPYNMHEMFLAALTDSAVTVPTPLTREERYLAKIAGESVTIPDAPYNRYETYLAKLAGEDVTVPTPASRLEVFLYKACGYDAQEPTPANREEIFWKRYIGSEFSGRTVMITDAAAGSPRFFTVSIVPNQVGSGDPTPTNVRPIMAWTGYEITQNGSTASGLQKTYTDTFGENVYAGTFDCMSGQLISAFNEYKYPNSSSDSHTIRYNTGSARRYYYFYPSTDVMADAVAPSTNALNSYGICSHYTVKRDITTAQFRNSDNSVMYSNSSVGSARSAIIRDTRFDDKSDVEKASFMTNAFTTENPLQIVYIRDSYAEKELTPPGIDLFAGENTFTCNCGTITIKYTPDL